MNEAGFYCNLPTLETKRLIIRRYSLEDVDDYFSFASDTEVTRFLRWGPHTNKDFTRDYLSGVLDAYRDGNDSPWGIELKAEKKLLGIIHLMQLDLYNRRAHIGVVLARPYWKNGYATEAVNAVLAESFTKLALNRVEAFCIPENQAGVRTAEKVGMQREGLLRQYAFQKEEFRDFLLFSILKADFEAG